jgi:hypothetical protein
MTLDTALLQLIPRVAGLGTHVRLTLLPLPLALTSAVDAGDGCASAKGGAEIGAPQLAPQCNAVARLRGRVQSIAYVHCPRRV